VHFTSLLNFSCTNHLDLATVAMAGNMYIVGSLSSPLSGAALVATLFAMGRQV